MIDYVHGIVKESKEKAIVLDINGFGLAFLTPQPEKFTPEVQAKLYTYLHWNAENGPSLFGFQTELDRRVFLLIIDCPKIGPGIALNILSQISASHFLEVVTTQNEEKLSSVNGIGAKKAEQIIVQLKHKVQKMLSTGILHVEEQESFIQWQQVGDVLISLNYSKQEVARAMHHLSEKYTSQNQPLDHLIRAALSYLSQRTI